MSSILNVGYGTANPKKLIHLVQNNVALRLQDIRTTGDRTTNIEFINGNTDIFSSNNFETDWRILNSNSLFCIQSGTSNIINNVMNFTNQGFIGIGTIQPRSKLDIIGKMTINGDIIPGINSNYNLGSPENKWKDLYLSGNSMFLNNLILSSDTSSNLNIKDTSGVYKNININSLQLNNYDKNLTLYIDETGLLTYVNAANVKSYAITTTNVTSANLDSSILTVDKGGTGVGTFALGQILIGNGTSNILQNTNLTWDNANSRLGIGTNNPTSKLEVYGGDITLKTNWISGSTMNLLGFSSSKRLEFSYNDGTALYDNNKIRFFSGWPHQERMVIATNGNVGIGTNNPLALLDVVYSPPSIANTDMFNIRVDGNWGLKLQQSFTTGGNIQYNMIHRYNGSDYNSLTFKGANVGIGTNNPSKRLHIVSATNNLVRIEANENLPSQVSGIEFGVPAFTSDTRCKITSTTYSGDASDLQFYTSSGTSATTSRMIIATNGNIGIGTSTNLNNKLNVNGTVSAILFSGTGSNLIDIPISGITNLQTTLDTNANNSSNYVLSTSNIISKRITDLTTDMITENITAANKFIVNNNYNNNLTVNGTLTINSNLIVLGDSTQLDTIVYTTERLEIVNANNTSSALMVQQNTNDRDIFVASNVDTTVFKIANNGDVNITGIYKKDNRDVIFDASNYILTASNNLINKIKENDDNSSNYILTASNNLINKIKENDNNSSNYILTASNNLIRKANLNDANSSNYILTTSNILAERINKYSLWTPSGSNIYSNFTGNVGIGTIIPNSKLHICDNSSNSTKLILQNNYGIVDTIPDIIIVGTTLTTIGTDKCITFPYSGTASTKSYTFTTTKDILCDILIVGGGGGGGYSYVGGGGGGGGYVYLQNINLPFGNYTVNVGAGGSLSTSGWGGNGGNSSITGMINYTAIGGGGGAGGSANGTISGIGNNGGSGGGGSYRNLGGVSAAGGTSIQFSTYGYGNGGNGNGYGGGSQNGGGGGGASGITNGTSEAGNNGLSNSITGTTITYAGGGGAGNDFNIQSQGGTGGGGGGGTGTGSYSAVQGTNGLGGGGGGARGNGSGPSAAGGSGIVIIRYRLSSVSTLNNNGISSASIDFVIGSATDTNTDYKIGNYNGNFKIMSSASAIDTNALVLTSNGNATLGGSLNATSYFLNGSPFSIATEAGYTSNYISSVNTSLINRINDVNATQLNYVLAANSNIGDGLSLVIYNMNRNDINSSNYVLETSNVIQKRINEITTDKIIEGPKNKYIVENKYNNDLDINGNVFINSNLIVNKSTTLRNNLNVTGDVNFTGDIYKNGMIYPNGKTYTGSSSILSQYSPIQTQFNMYKNVVEKSGSGWQFIDNNINIIDEKVQGFCIRIKPNHYSSKILINLNCHIGIDYGTDARWWGLRLYRKIGELGEWTHISNADGTDYNNNNGTTCWLSHNLGADSSSYSYFIANVSGAYYDIPGISEDYIYYTAKWCSLLGDNTQNGKLYLNRPAIINTLNAPVVSSSWNVSEIWQLETSYFPKGGIVTKYTPTQTQFNIYKNVVEKLNGGWQFIDNNTEIINNNIQGFCVRIRPNHYTSKILINLTCHIGIDYGTDARWWGLRLYRKIGEDGVWTHLTDANGNSYNGGTPCWLSHNLGAESSTYSYFIANVSGAYYDMPNAMDTYVYYTVQWCSQLGDAMQNGKLYLNRPATYNSANSAILSSTWNAQEIWQLETTFIPKNAVICQNMSIQTLFNIYRNIVIKTGYDWQFIDNNINIINEKIQGFCVRIKPTHPSSKVLIHLSCHIGIDYGTDARWWGLRLYRKIGEGGEWVHISDADGNNLIDNQGTSCWLSHNLGAESSTSSYFVANISGSFFDLPGTSSEFIYYTAKWCSQLGDNSYEGKIYLNRPASYNNSNSAVLSSSWNAQEIWQLGTPYEPAEYSIINIFNNNNVGIGNTNPICKLDVNGTINAINYSTISDRRFKKDIQPINSSLDLINRINPVSYLTIEQNDGDKKNYGFIAQDLHNIIPEAVNVPINDSHKYTIEYMSIIPLLAKSIQELSEKINNQQKTIDDLNNKLNNK